MLVVGGVFTLLGVWSRWRGHDVAPWALLALGAGGAVATPFLAALGVHTSTSQMVLHQAPSFAETAVLLGFAVLIIRTRVKEG